MSLQAGTTLGPYEIQAPLGAGGMGEVLKARDTRLDRTVAIKVLPEHVASDPDRRQRFEREAKTISSLNHAHICTLHDIGSQDGIDFLVMEYLDGETLAQRLEKGALPLDQALAVAIEIADALDKAHRQGITHRDLKPGNIMLTKSGAKLIDFGLAKLKPSRNAPVRVSAPTVSASLTGEGAILGTLQYMAPEQLEGKEADARTDIFAFGAVVHEMVTGKRAFEGDSQASLIGAILKDDPRTMSALQPLSPSTLDRVIKKCLAKDPEKRWHTAHDLHDELQWISEGDAQVPVPVPIAAAARLSGWRRALPLALGTLAVVITALALWVLRPAPRLTTPVRFVESAPPGPVPAQPTNATELAISPDGRAIVYRAVVDGEDGLYVRRLDRLEADLLTSLSTTGSVFMSPDGAWVGFATGVNQTLKKVQVSGGPALTLCPMPSPPPVGQAGDPTTRSSSRDPGTGTGCFASRRPGVSPRC